MKDALMTNDDVKKVEAVTELKDEVLGGFSFAPVSNVTDEETEQKIKEEKKSERMEKLRSYYEKLGQTRDLMQQELSKILAGEAGDEEIDKKLYEFTHSRKMIADEINKYDEEHGHPRGQSNGERYIGQSLIGNDYEGLDLAEADFSAANLQDANFKNARPITASLFFSKLPYPLKSTLQFHKTCSKVNSFSFFVAILLPP